MFKRVIQALDIPIQSESILTDFCFSIQGATTIRAFNQQQRFFTENEARVTSHLHCNYIRSKKWTGLMDKPVDERMDGQK